MSTFNAIDYIHHANEREQAVRSGKPVEPKAADPNDPKAADGKPAAVDLPADPADNGEHAGRVSRSTRRLLRQLGEAEGRAKAFEEIAKSGKPDAAAPAKAAVGAADADPEPQEKDFTDFKDYYKALGKWEARQETKKALTTDKQQNEQQDALKDQIAAAAAKADVDAAALADWNEVIEAAKEDGPEFDPKEHPTLMMLIATSDEQARVLYHLAKHPAELEKMLDLTKAPNEQIRQFHRLEGRVERLYATEQKPDSEKDGEKKTPPAAERDARKAAPSESVAVHGGSAPPTQVSPVLADGRTLNPAWKERANEREGRRR